jgi:hypothetical protein
MIGTDVGGNFGAPIIGLTFSYTSPDKLDPWITNCDIDAQGLNITTAGTINSGTLIRNPGIITVPANSSDFSKKLSNSGFSNAPELLQKGITEYVTNSSTLQDDGVFSFSASAGERVYLELELIVYGSAGGDIKLGFTGPAGSGGDISFLGNPSTVSDVSDSNFGLRSVGLGTAVVLGCDGISQQLIKVQALLACGTAGGNFKLQWAQGTPNSTATEIRSSSISKLYRGF